MREFAEMILHVVDCGNLMKHSCMLMIAEISLAFFACGVGGGGTVPVARYGSETVLFFALSCQRSSRRTAPLARYGWFRYLPCDFDEKPMNIEENYMPAYAVLLHIRR